MSEPNTKSKFLRILAVAFTLGLAYAPLAIADDIDGASALAQSTTTLPEVVVTGRRATLVDIPVHDNPATVNVLDQETRRARGDRTNTEAVEKVVGWSGAYTPGNGVVFSARGFVGNDISALNDGVRISNPTLSARQFDSFMFDRIEVLNGPASVLHGEGAVSGAVNYVSKQPNPESREAEAVVRYGAFNTAQAAFGAGGPASENRKLSYRIDGTVGHSDGVLDEGEYERYQVNGAVRYDVSKDLGLTFRVDGFADDLSSYFGLPLVNGQVDERVRNKNYNVSDNKTRSDQVTLRLEADYRVSEHVGFQNRLYALNANRIWRNAEAYRFDAPSSRVEITSLGDVRHEQFLFGNRFHAQLTRPLFGDDNRLAVGFDVSTNNLRRNANFPSVSFFVDAFSPNTPTFNTLNANAPLNPGATTVMNSYDLFVEDQIELSDGLKLVGGFRADFVDVDVDNHTSGLQDRKLFVAPTWRAGIVYDVRPTTTLYAHYADGETVPALADLGRALTFGTEKSREAEFGIRQRLWNDRIDLTVAVYDLVKEDLLTQRAGDPTTTENIGKQSSQGIEISLEAEPIDGWRVGGNGSILTTEFDEFNSGGRSLAGNTPANVPKQLGNIWTSYRFANGFEIGANLRYVGQRAGDNNNSFGLPSYTTFDAFAAYRRGNLEFSIRGRNLTDELTLLWAETDYGQQVQVGEPLAVEARLALTF